MIKYSFGYSGDGWRAYARRMLEYDRVLKAAGLPFEHGERQRARDGYRMARAKVYAEERHISAAGRLLRVIARARNEKCANYTPINRLAGFFRLFN